MTKLTGEYKGYQIEYDEEAMYINKQFHARIGDSDMHASSLKSIKSKIDNINRKNFKRTKVLLPPNWNHKKATPAEVTSHIDNHYVWVVKKNSRRSKERADNIYLDCEESRSKITQAESVKMEIDVLKDKMDKIIRSIPRYEIKD